MKRPFYKSFIAGIMALGTLVPAGIAYAQAYGAGNYGACTYGNNCPVTSSLLPDTGSLILILSGLGALILAAIIFIVLSRKRKRRRSMMSAAGATSAVPTGTVAPAEASNPMQSPATAAPPPPTMPNQPSVPPTQPTDPMPPPSAPNPPTAPPPPAPPAV